MRPGIRLGVDVGTVRVGVATCDPGAVLATPVDTLPRRDLSAGPDAEPSIRAIACLAGEVGALEVVVGLPRSLSGEEGPAAQAVREYARALAAALRPVPVRLVDERLTTAGAHRALHASGLKMRSHRSVVDRVAAVMILQGALDAERESGMAPGEVVGARKPRHRRPRA